MNVAPLPCASWKSATGLPVRAEYTNALPLGPPATISRPWSTSIPRENRPAALRPAVAALAPERDRAGPPPPQHGALAGAQAAAVDAPAGARADVERGA